MHQATPPIPSTVSPCCLSIPILPGSGMAKLELFLGSWMRSRAGKNYIFNGGSSNGGVGGEAGYTLRLKLVLITLAYGHRGWKSLATHAHEPTADCHVIATCMNSSQQRPFFTHNVPPPITLCISFPLHLVGLLFFKS